MHQEENFPGRKVWEEDYVLKQSFSALVPAFDPRPGHANVSQIQDFPVEAAGGCGVWVGMAV